MYRKPDFEPIDFYLAALEAERKAEKKLRKLAAQMARECFCIWRKGDGRGGHVLDVVSKEFHKLVGEDEVYSSGKNRRKIHHKVRTMVFERDKYRCVKCNSYKQLCIDHIHPYSLGGSDEPDNLQTLCWDCNSKKSNKVEAP